jgi:hypothetical protein
VRSPSGSLPRYARLWILLAKLAIGPGNFGEVIVDDWHLALQRPKMIFPIDTDTFPFFLLFENDLAVRAPLIECVPAPVKAHFFGDSHEHWVIYRSLEVLGNPLFPGLLFEEKEACQDIGSVL